MSGKRGGGGFWEGGKGVSLFSYSFVILLFEASEPGSFSEVSVPEFLLPN
jgi:hypothetical protein